MAWGVVSSPSAGGRGAVGGAVPAARWRARQLRARAFPPRAPMRHICSAVWLNRNGISFMGVSWGTTSDPVVGTDKQGESGGLAKIKGTKRRQDPRLGYSARRAAAPAGMPTVHQGRPNTGAGRRTATHPTISRAASRTSGPRWRTYSGFLVPDGLVSQGEAGHHEGHYVPLCPAHRLYDLHLGRAAVGIDLRHPRHLCQREFEYRVARFHKPLTQQKQPFPLVPLALGRRLLLHLRECLGRLPLFRLESTGRRPPPSSPTATSTSVSSEAA